MLWKARAGAAALCLLVVIAGAGFSRPAFADAQAVVDGAAQLRSGNYNAAVTTLSAALNTDLSSQDAADALFFRGLAYRKLGHATEAIADLGAAIWIGLSTTDRIVALVQRSYAFQSLGLQQQAQYQVKLARMAAPHETAEVLKDGDVIGNIGTASNGDYGGWWNRITAGIRAPNPETASAPASSGSPANVAGWSISVDQADAAVASQAAREHGQAAPPASQGITPSDAVADTAPAQTSSSGSRLGRLFGWGSSSGSAAQSAPATSEPSGWSTETQASPQAAPATSSATTGWSVETHQQ
jgi:tetratricopeptide (TPR) repeat protein